MLKLLKKDLDTISTVVFHLFSRIIYYVMQTHWTIHTLLKRKHNILLERHLTLHQSQPWQKIADLNNLPSNAKNWQGSDIPHWLP